MSFKLDSAVYDLGTVEGQQSAIDDMIREINSQFDQSSGMTTYDVVAYTQLTVTLIDGSPTGTYTTPYLHGLGFAPVVLCWLLPGGNPDQHIPLGYLEMNFAPGGKVLTQDKFRVDDQFLYYDVFAVSTGGHFSSLNHSAAFYIFNIPARVGLT